MKKVNNNLLWTDESVFCVSTPHIEEHMARQRWFLDRSTFKTERAHKMALSATLKSITEKLAGSIPTVLWTGNGFHIYQPICAFPLEEEKLFSKYDHPLKFAE